MNRKWGLLMRSNSFPSDITGTGRVPILYMEPSQEAKGWMFFRYLGKTTQDRMFKLTTGPARDIDINTEDRKAGQLVCGTFGRGSVVHTCYCISSPPANVLLSSISCGWGIDERGSFPPHSQHI